MAKFFFPPLKAFCKKLNLNESDFLDAQPDDKEVKIPLSLLKALLLAAISDLQVDAQSYAEENSDVARAFKTLNEYAEHFRRAGYFEGRTTPILFDPDFYVSHYPDIAVAVKLHGIDPREHYVKAGIFEQRIPTAQARAEVDYWSSKLADAKRS